ncbi:uncharacterized protein LOC112091879 [Morus notabilis]|uniref:uncharacterized protein LOC112091879 n=1 Tax=Morus notabilis TaxID=981085 RepID=UPI000CED10AB|nr:uncharacterized protein LOC112091879 [Morus notabilis]
MNFKAAMVGSSSATSDATSGMASSGTISQSNSIVSFSENSLQITVHKLNGKNYLEWSQFVRLVIDNKGKYGHLNGEEKPPATSDPKYRQWRSENSMVTAWLINLMDPVVGKPFMFLPTARDVWEAVRKLWQELDMFEDEQWENSNDNARYKKKVERGRVFVFLAGLNKDLDEVQGRILGKRPLLTIRGICRGNQRVKLQMAPLLRLLGIDLTSEKMIGGARLDSGLYLFNNGSTFGRQDQQACFNSISVSSDS